MRPYAAMRRLLDIHDKAVSVAVTPNGNAQTLFTPRLPQTFESLWSEIVYSQQGRESGMAVALIGAGAGKWRKFSGKEQGLSLGQAVGNTEFFIRIFNVHNESFAHGKR